MLTRLIAHSRHKRREQFRCGNGQYSGSNSDEAMRCLTLIVARHQREINGKITNETFPLPAPVNGLAILGISGWASF
jgi:hypothetical protein